VTPTRTNLDNILACMREFSDCISEYELNREGLDRKDIEGMKGFVGVRYVFDRRELEQLRDSLPDVKVIDVDSITEKGRTP
jgi:hypothetical protein